MLNIKDKVQSGLPLANWLVMTLSSSSENLSGLVERVTYHNPDNGFCVLRIQVKGKKDLLTVTGNASTISAGEFIQATGQWHHDRHHGLQFKAQFLTATAPTTLEGIEKYLGSGLIKGIGPVYAKKLVKAFRENVLGQSYFLRQLMQKLDTLVNPRTNVEKVCPF